MADFVFPALPHAQFWMNYFFPYLAQMMTSISGCVAHKDLWPYPISTRSFSHDFAIKLLNYGTFFRFCSTSRTAQNRYFSYLAQMITGMRGCVTHNDPSPWHFLSSLQHSYHRWHKCSPWEGVSRTMTFDHDTYLQCHPAVTVIIMLKYVASAIRTDMGDFFIFIHIVF